MSFLDGYEIRARFIPTFIVMLPVFFTINFILVNKNIDLLPSLGSSLLSVIVLLYPFSFLIRSLGKEKENELWPSWNGPPSTRFLRWRDTTFGNVLKKQLHEAVAINLRIDLLSQEEEAQDNVLADSLINQAFLQVRPLIRKYDPGGLVYKHNAEYGLNRNLMGSRILWFIFSTLGIVVCAALIAFKGYFANLYLYLNILWLLLSLIGGWVFLPKFVKDCADRYAENSWNTFLVYTNTQE